jgi:ATP-dependent DNA ligase
VSLFNRGRMEIKLGDYAVGTASALTDPLLVNRAQDYRRMTGARMLPLDATEVTKKIPTGDYHVSRKVDGEFDLLAYQDGEAVLVNPGGTVRVGLPLLKEAAEQLKKAGMKRAIVAGEFHYVDPKGKRPRVHDVSRAARQPAGQADLDALHFAVFDLVSLNGVEPAANFANTWKTILELFAKGKRVAPVEAVTLKEPKEIEEKFQEWVSKGAEGAVVRSDAAGMFKIKPRHTLDAAVIGFTEGADDRQGMVHDLLLAVMRPEGVFQVLGRVGGGFTEDDRRKFLSDLKDRAAESEYTEVNDQVAYQMVRPEWVIEVSVLDLITQTTRGAPITRMALDWDRPSTRWRTLRRLPLAAPISPQFVRRREDKHVVQQDVRIQQVADLVEVQHVERDARQFKLPASEVLRREVYTKQMKGQTMVRKLVMWQTNKDKVSEDYPAYTIHFTDFSPNRKTPLERDLRISNSKEQIAQLWDALAEENVKKGWTLEGTAVAAPVEDSPPAEKKPAAGKKAKGKKPAADAESSAQVEPPPPAKKPSKPRKE